MHFPISTAIVLIFTAALGASQTLTLTPYPTSGCSGSAGPVFTTAISEASAFCADSAGWQSYQVGGDESLFPVGMAGCDDDSCGSCDIDDACSSISASGCLDLAHPDGEYKDSQSVQLSDGTLCDPGYLKMRRALERSLH